MHLGVFKCHLCLYLTRVRTSLKSHALCPVVLLLLFHVVLLSKLLEPLLTLLSWASYQIRKIAGCACAGSAGNVSPRRRLRRKPLVSDPGMHHGTCVTHVPWCMSGSLTCGDGENVPGIPGASAPTILRVWQEPHCCLVTPYGDWKLAQHWFI